jgi:hypothetical protein
MVTMEFYVNVALPSRWCRDERVMLGLPSNDQGGFRGRVCARLKKRKTQCAAALRAAGGLDLIISVDRSTFMWSISCALIGQSFALSTVCFPFSCGDDNFFSASESLYNEKRRC